MECFSNPSFYLSGRLLQDYIASVKWEDYAIASGLSASDTYDDGNPNEAAIKQSAATLRSVMGRACAKILPSLTTLPPADQEKPDAILAALSDHFVLQRNILFDRYKLSNAMQNSSENCNNCARQTGRLCFIVRLTSLVPPTMVIRVTRAIQNSMLVDVM